MVYDYDKFNIGATAVTTTAVSLGHNSSGSLAAAVNYRMRLSGLNMINSGTAAATVTIQKVSGTNAAIVIFEQGLAASGTVGDTVTLQEDQDIVVESGYYVQALMSVGTGAVFATGEFILE